MRQSTTTQSTMRQGVALHSPPDKHGKARDHKVAVELFLLAAAALYLELTVIRWMSGDLLSMAVFKTFPLVASFIGLGAGYACKTDRLFKWTPLTLLGFVAVMKLTDLTGMSSLCYPSNAQYHWTVFNFEVVVWVFLFLIFLPWMAAVLAFPFFTMMGVGARLGRLFNQMDPLRAYSFDILGSLFGSVLFSLSSFLCAPPSLLIAFPAVLIAFYRRDVLRSGLPLLLAVLVAALPVHDEQGVCWTPYHRLQRNPVLGTLDGKDATLGVQIKVNRCFQQYFFPNLTPHAKVGPRDIAGQMFTRERYHNFPYCFKSSPENVLILGCGAGQDVLAAVQHGARSIDAVEIDPIVIQIGKSVNPAYKSPLVHLYNADARHFVEQCHKKYDLIVFACLDSFAVTGLGSSVRIDSYVHTKESLARTLSLLNSDGVLVMTFGAGGEHWLRDRLFSTLEQAAGYEPLYFTDEHSPLRRNAFIYVAGPSIQRHVPMNITLPKGYEPEKLTFNSSAGILTDDWPYLYLSPQKYDLPYGLLVCEIILLSLFVARKTIFAMSAGASSWQMMFLGAGFLLLELQAISRLALIFGTTWLTSALVINGVLVMILIANILVIKRRGWLSQPLVYGLLAASLLTNYLLPVGSLVSFEFGKTAVVILTLLPMFLAGVIFASAFARVSDPAIALGFNLFGAVMGALLELLSSFIGVKALLLVALALYFGSFLALRKGCHASAAGTAHDHLGIDLHEAERI